MSVEVILPKLGNSVESSIISTWLKAPGESVTEGEPLCVVETDKSTMEVVSTASGVLLQQLVQVGDDVLVLAPIARIGAPHEAIVPAAPDAAKPIQPQTEPIQLAHPSPSKNGPAPSEGHLGVFQTAQPAAQEKTAISPRARKLAQASGIDIAALTGTGPGGRIIERDVQSARAITSSGTRRVGEDVRLTPVAQAMVASGAYVAPERGSGPSGRITKQDLTPIDAPSPMPDKEIARPAATLATSPVASTPLAGVRRLIAERMRASLQTTAQLTLNASADARAMLAYRKTLKASDETLGLREVTINDLVLLAVAKTLPRFPDLNATLNDGLLARHSAVHLGFAVDTPRGLLVPVIRDADGLSLRALAEAARSLAGAARDGKLAPDHLSGGTFTVSNLGQFGIESFTPILNVPQVAILGVGSVTLKPVEASVGDSGGKGDDEGQGEVMFVPHLGLSLTIDHQAVDGAPAARFLQALVRSLANFELMLAL